MLMANRMGDEETARRYARAYLKHGPAGAQSDAIRLMFKLADAAPSQRQDLLRAASDEVLFATFNKVAWWTDPDELAIEVARELASRKPKMSPGDSVIATFDLGFALAWRGQVRAAHRVIGSQPSRLFGALAILGGVPDDTAAMSFQRLLGIAAWPPTQLPMAITWWGARRDTLSLQRAVMRADEVVKNPPHGFARAYAANLAESARAHMPLIRGDTLASIERFKALPDTACPACFSDRIVLARLLIGAGRLQDAASLLTQDLADGSAQNNPLSILWSLERGRLAERLGDRANAMRRYDLVDAAWRNADPSIQWAVDSARSGRKRVAAK
jgi:hypothetical protein